MREANLKVLQDYFAAMGAGDREKAATYYHPEVVLEVPGHHAASGTHEGLEGVGRFGAAMAQATGGTFRLTPVDLLASDDHVVTIGKASATVGDRSMEWDRVIVSRVVDGKLAHLRFFEADQAAVDAFLAP
ncbi:MAG: nuclear transport factor 2 family protein [Solirubrobacteraceae bacterium]